MLTLDILVDCSPQCFLNFIMFLGVCAHAHEPVAPHKFGRSENSSVELVPCVCLYMDFRDPADVARLACRCLSPLSHCWPSTSLPEAESVSERRSSQDQTDLSC